VCPATGGKEEQNWREKNTKEIKTIARLHKINGFAKGEWPYTGAG
jgi:hypothetical protein